MCSNGPWDVSNGPPLSHGTLSVAHGPILSSTTSVPFVQALTGSGTICVQVNELQVLLWQRDPTEEEVSRPIWHSDRKYINCDYNVCNSVGAVFAKSLHRDRKPRHMQGRICARGGGEMQWYNEADLSYLSCPEVFTGTVNFELVNQIQDPGRCPLLNLVFTFGQVVWRHRTFPTLGGCKLEYDLDPYIIITVFHNVPLCSHDQLQTCLPASSTARTTRASPNKLDGRMDPQQLGHFKRHTSSSPGGPPPAPTLTDSPAFPEGNSTFGPSRLPSRYHFSV